MITKIDEFILAHKGDMIESLRESLRIPSVKAEPAPGAPFGRDVRRALDHFLALAESLGFTCVNMDGYVGYAEFGSGDEMLGVLCHLDVVPEGIGWVHPPYAAEIEDDVLYGRGTTDDKGPAFSALYAMYAVKECALKTNRRVRLIVGCDEESGWGCMDHYKQFGEVPAIAFSPDGDYPVVNSEKGILRATFKRGFESKISIESGSRPNVVPNDAKIFVPLPMTTVMPIIDAATDITGDYPIDIVKDAGGCRITVTGKGAHASLPEFGKNALLASFELLSRLPLEGIDGEVVAQLRRVFKHELHGESLALDITDESGRTTVNPGVMRWDKNGIQEYSIDMRCPTSLRLADVLCTLEGALAGYTLIDSELKDGLFVPEDSELVKKLLMVYGKRTGTTPKPLAIGGGTYARAFKNAVAFGCEDPNAPESLVHMPNECITIADQMMNTYMIADAIIALATDCGDE